MIVYDVLWETLKEKSISQYDLVKKYHISSGQMDRLRKNQPVSTNTINNLCTILHCDMNGICRYVEDDYIDDNQSTYGSDRHCNHDVPEEDTKK